MKPLSVCCPKCGRRGMLDQRALGRAVKCKKCHSRFVPDVDELGSAETNEMAGIGPTTTMPCPSANACKETGASVIRQAEQSSASALLPDDLSIGLAPVDEEDLATEVTNAAEVVIDTCCPNCGKEGYIPEKFEKRPLRCRQCACAFIPGGPLLISTGGPVSSGKRHTPGRRPTQIDPAQSVDLPAPPPFVPSTEALFAFHSDAGVIITPPTGSTVSGLRPVAETTASEGPSSLVAPGRLEAATLVLAGVSLVIGWVPGLPMAGLCSGIATILLGYISFWFATIVSPRRLLWSGLGIAVALIGIVGSGYYWNNSDRATPSAMVETAPGTNSVSN